MATIIRKDAWMLAKDLAAALAETPEVLAFQQAENAVMCDPESMALIDEFEVTKRSVKFSKSLPKAEQERLVYAFMNVEERFNAHPGIQAYANARHEVDMLLERINLVLTYPLTGKEAPSRQVGCGSSGGGCGCGG